MSSTIKEGCDREVLGEVWAMLFWCFGSFIGDLEKLFGSRKDMFNEYLKNYFKI